LAICGLCSPDGPVVSPAGLVSPELLGETAGPDSDGHVYPADAEAAASMNNSSMVVNSS
jgi:hypothetical protein